MTTPGVFHGRGRAACAFSLIEIISAVAILATLLAILIPQFKKAIERSQGAVCLERMRAVMSAERMYSADHDGWLVPYQRPTGVPGYADNWVVLLAPYATGTEWSDSRNEWVQCPSQKLTTPYKNRVSGISPVFTDGFLANGHILHQGSGNVADGVQISAKASAIREPSRTPSWMDACGGGSNGFPVYCRGCFPNIDATSIGVGITEKNNIGSRHLGGANVGFVDGHIELVDLETLQKRPSFEDDFYRHYDYLR